MKNLKVVFPLSRMVSVVSVGVGQAEVTSRSREVNKDGGRVNELNPFPHP